MWSVNNLLLVGSDLMCLPSLSMERTVTGSRFKISVVQNWTGHLENVNDWQDLLHEIYWGTAGAKAR